MYDDVEWDYRIRQLKRMNDRQRRRKPHVRFLLQCVAIYALITLGMIGSQLTVGGQPWHLYVYGVGVVILFIGVVPLFRFDWREDQRELDESLHHVPSPSVINIDHGQTTIHDQRGDSNEDKNTDG